MTTTAEKIKVMQAFEDGAEIEWHNGSQWVSREAPEWNWCDCDYRIAPKPPATILVGVDMENNQISHTTATETYRFSAPYRTCKYIFDGYVD